MKASQKPNQASLPPEDLIIVGQIGGVHGVKGAIRVFSFTEPKTQLLEYKPWFVEKQGQWETLAYHSAHWHGESLLVQFENINDRDKAQALTNKKIAVKRHCLPPLAPSEYYWIDLIGLSVYTREGVFLGLVENLMETGANDVLIVKDGSRSRLIPYLLNQYIDSIDLSKKQIIVDWDPEF